jgi:hypothetical protein
VDYQLVYVFFARFPPNDDLRTRVYRWVTRSTDEDFRSLRCPRFPWSPQQTCQTSIPGFRQCRKDYIIAYAEGESEVAGLEMWSFVELCGAFAYVAECVFAIKADLLCP